MNSQFFFHFAQKLIVNSWLSYLSSFSNWNWTELSYQAGRKSDNLIWRPQQISSNYCSEREGGKKSRAAADNTGLGALTSTSEALSRSSFSLDWALAHRRFSHLLWPKMRTNTAKKNHNKEKWPQRVLKEWICWQQGSAGSGQRGGQVELAQKKRISTYNEFLLQTRESSRKCIKKSDEGK